MAKKIILALLILILIIVLGILFLGNDTVDIYNDGENVSVETVTFADIDRQGLNEAICDYTFNVMNDTETDVMTYRNGIEGICKNYGLDNVEINIDSSIGANQIPVLVHVDGTSMLPTLQDGQTVLLNKTHDVHVGDIVVADSEEYGGIIKRVEQISDGKIHLISDNKNVSYELINGDLYRVEGITTWVDLNDINGVVISY